MFDKRRTVLVIIDFQEKLAAHMHEKEGLTDSICKLIRGVRALDVPVLWAEQNPGGLGPTVAEAAQAMDGLEAITKMSFSCCGSGPFVQALHALGRDQVLAAGIEAHVCGYQKAGELLGVPGDKVYGLLRNAWKVSKGQDEFSDGELFLGMSMVARYSLDPIAKEIYLARGKEGRVMLIIGVDGLVKILDRTDHYDGFEQTYDFDEKTEQMTWCETRIFSKKRSHPAVYRAFASEYAQLAGFMYKKIPWHMLRLFSLHHATRLFTPIGGVTTRDEFNFINHTDAPTGAPPTTLDELTDRTEQPAKQQPKSSGNGNRDTATTEPGPTDPTLEETPQDEPEAGTSVLDDYKRMLDSASNQSECNEVQRVAEAINEKGELSDESLAKVFEMCEKRREQTTTSSRRRKTPA